MTGRITDDRLDMPGGWGRRNESRLLVSAQASRRHRIAVLLGCCLLSVAFWLVGGFPGVFAAAVTIAIWYAFGVPFAIATGVVFAGAAGVESLSAVALVGFALFAVSLVPATLARTPSRHVFATVLLTTGLGTVTALLASATQLWLVALGVLASLAIGAYGLHRYQLLVLGILSGDGSLSTGQDRPADMPVGTSTDRSDTSENNTSKGLNEPTDGHGRDSENHEEPTVREDDDNLEDRTIMDESTLTQDDPGEDKR
jgi:hypothetical protein